MTQWLKEGLAGTLNVGPIVNGSGIAQPSLTITLADIKLSKAGGAYATIHNPTGAIPDKNGNYFVLYDATDVNTRGMLNVQIQPSGMLPVWDKYMVVPTQKFDYFFGNGVVATVSRVLSVGSVDAAAIGTIGHSRTVGTTLFTRGGMIGSVAWLADGLVGTIKRAMSVGSIDAGIIGTALTNFTAARAGYLDELAAANLPADIDTVLTRLTATRATYLDYLFSIYFGLVSAVAQAQGGSTTSITLAASSSGVTDFYKGQTVVIYTGTGAGQARAISAYNGTSNVATVSPAWATAPDATSWYVIIAVGSAIVDDWTDGGRLDLLLDAIKAKTDNLPVKPQKNVALSNVPFLMVLSSNHVTRATGKTVTCEISKDGGAFVACTNASAEIGSGWYKIDLIQAEMNADKIILKFTETDCDQTDLAVFTNP